MGLSLRGTGVALVTPFNAKKELDLVGLGKLLEHTQNYVDFWVVHGTTGESVTTNRREKQAVVDFIKANNRNSLPLVYGLGGNSTIQILEFLQDLNTDGIDAFLSVSPYYNKPTQEGIYRHYMSFADASPKPIILYNVPARTGSNMSAETTLKLAQHPNIIGIKEASGDIQQCMHIIKNKPKDFVLFAGDDALTVPLIALGAVGVIAVMANVFPKTFTEMTDLALEGKFEAAKNKMFELLDANALMFAEGNPVGVKQALALSGVCSSYVRLPLVEASEQLKARMSKIIETLVESAI
ncbi:MAG: 4-hydroxy-tetrahydrodipicolinate synthase [Cytophagales bacterium]|nr:MAG: 4-hydroxy-tetrahydrodipicolinate synthase [Cytophagales bacterium]TAF60801.1 MAG: 4-hydroxy-tetrahydrodipicolinate synthase [Cytophagales bacterium]